MTELTRYEAAEHALAAAEAVDEVLEVRSQAAAWIAYARQAKNRDLEIKAARIRFRAERRLGEMLLASDLSKGGRPTDKTCSDSERVFDAPATLAQAGIDRKLSSRSQRLALMNTAEFEHALERQAEEMRAGKGRVAMDLLKVDAEEKGRAHRRNLAAALSQQSVDLPAGRRYPAAYIDLPWKREGGIGDRSYENHYPTMTWPEILDFLRRSRGSLLPDSWAFFWIPRAHLLALVEIELEVTVSATGEVVLAMVEVPLGWAVGQALGMDSYSTCFVWTKTDSDHPDVSGSGLIAWDQDELLLLFKRGRGLPKPSGGEKYGSNHRERATDHSRKPAHYRKMIADMVGLDDAGDPLPVLEMFARVDAENPLPIGWDACGNQAGAPPIEISTPAPPADQQSSFAGVSSTGETVTAAGEATQARADVAAAVTDNSEAAPIAAELEAPAPRIHCVRGPSSLCDDVERCKARGDCKLFPFVRAPAAPIAAELDQVAIAFEAALSAAEFCDWRSLAAVVAGGSIEPAEAQRLVAGDYVVDQAGRLALTEAGQLWLRSLEFFVERTERLEGRSVGIDLAPALPIAAPAPQLTELDVLKAISDFCYPRRLEILPAIVGDYIARGLAFSASTSADWLLTSAGWQRLRELEAERLAQRLAAEGDQVPEIVDGVLQCRLPLDEAELERHRALTAIAAGAALEGEIVRDLVGVGLADVTGEQLIVTPDGQAWLQQFVDAPAPKPKTIPAPDLPLFAATRPVNAVNQGVT